MTINPIYRCPIYLHPNVHNKAPLLLHLYHIFDSVIQQARAYSFSFPVFSPRSALLLSLSVPIFMYYCASHCHPSGLLFRQPRRLAPFSTFKSPPLPLLPLQSSTKQPPPYNLIVFLHRTQRKFTIPLKMTRFHSDSMHCMILLIHRLPCSLTNHHLIHPLLLPHSQRA